VQLRVEELGRISLDLERLDRHAVRIDKRGGRAEREPDGHRRSRGLLPEQGLIVGVHDDLAAVGDRRLPEQVWPVPIRDQLDEDPPRLRCLVEEAALRAIDEALGFGALAGDRLQIIERAQPAEILVRRVGIREYDVGRMGRPFSGEGRVLLQEASPLSSQGDIPAALAGGWNARSPRAE